MNGLSKGVNAVDQCRSWSVEQLVSDAIDSAILHSTQVVPAALLDDALQGHAVPGSAPGSNDYVGINGGDSISLSRRARRADELAVRSLDQFHDPELGMD